LQAAAYRGLGGGHLYGSGGKTAGLDDAHKGLHQLDAVAYPAQQGCGGGWRCVARQGDDGLFHTLNV